MKRERGIVYLVWGEAYRQELQRSIVSVERARLPYEVVDLGDGDWPLDRKVEMYERSPFATTLFLDTDTIVMDPDLDFGFAMAERHGVALCHAPVGYARRWRGIADDRVEYNTGVLFFSRGPRVADLFAAWQAQLGPWPSDQQGFAMAVHETGSNPFVLPANWNFRPRYHGNKLFGPLKIWHDRFVLPQPHDYQREYRFWRPSSAGWKPTTGEAAAIAAWRGGSRATNYLAQVRGMSGPTICTIIAKNYVAQARCLTRSFLARHPGGKVYVLLLDELNNYFDPAGEPFELVAIDDLTIPELPAMVRRYTVRELATAVKPYFLAWLLEQGVGSVCYLDPDIYFYGSLNPVWEKLRDGAQVVLTPHLLGPIGEERRPDEFSILAAGTYNLGFIGVRDTAAVRSFLQWWQQRLVRYAHAKPAAQQHFDQRWIDLLPGFLDDVAVLRHPGLNAAFWDLVNRRVERVGEEWLVNGQPLVFFHFSGYRPDEPAVLSRHQDRFSLEELPDLRALFDEYRAALLGAGWERAYLWPYELGRRYRLPVLQVTEQSVALLRHKLVRSLRLPGPMVWGAGSKIVQRLGWADALALRLGEERVTRWRGYFFAWRFGRLPGESGARTAGLNVVGYWSHPTGVGEAGRRVLKALDDSHVPVARLAADDDTTMMLAPWLERVVDGAPHTVNLMLVNADQTAQVWQRLRPELRGATRTVGYWWWEADRWPEHWQDRFRYVDEVWVGSEYVREILIGVTDKPIRVMGVPVDPPAVGSDPRAALGLAPDDFVAATVLDARHFLKRKNPYGAIEAFRQAFGGKPGGAHLVVKVAHGEADAVRVARLRRLVTSLGGTFIDAVWLPQQLAQLLVAADVYVSLHRAEGFGLVLAEAMALGKPVIATNYSGNTDYMTRENSLLVDYQLVSLAQEVGPYPAGSAWAEADVGQAAAYLRKLRADPALGRTIGARAASEVQAQYSSTRVAERMLSRLAAVGHEVGLVQ